MIHDRMAYGIGELWMMIAGALSMIAVGVLVIALAGMVGSHLFRNLRRVYCLSVIAYWLPRLEKEGYRVFARAEADDRAKHRAAGE